MRDWADEVERQCRQVMAKALLAGCDAPSAVVGAMGAAVDLARGVRTPGTSWQEMADALAAGLKSITDQVRDSDA